MVKVIDGLRRHNEWRRGETDEPMMPPKELGICIDAAIDFLQQYEKSLDN